MQNPFQNFNKHDWVIWILSVIIVATSNILTGEIKYLPFALRLSE